MVPEPYLQAATEEMRNALAEDIRRNGKYVDTVPDFWLKRFQALPALQREQRDPPGSARGSAGSECLDLNSLD